MKKDTLWVKWVHGKYIKYQDWEGYWAPTDSSWYWKKLETVNDLFVQGLTNKSTWLWQGHQKYTIQQRYQWLLGELEYKQWSKAIWARAVITIHSSTARFLIQRRLPVRSRITRFIGQSFERHRAIRETEEEDIDHLFFSCKLGKRALAENQGMVAIINCHHKHRHLIHSL